MTGVSVVVEGIAFWSGRLPGWEIARAAIRGEREAPEAALKRPAPMLLAPTERRRAPDTVAIALEVASRACEAAQRAPAELPSVFASTHGDLAISDYMCATLAQSPTLLSPTKFHNSVHNAAAGYWSIGTSSYTPYTAISAFHYTFATGLLEAVTQVASERKPVLYVAFDVEATGALATMAPSRGLLGGALVLAPSDAGRPGQYRLACELDSGPTAAPTQPQSTAAALVAQNALAPCLPLFEALAADGPREVVLALAERLVLRVVVSPPQQ
jgi:hypothetical protein